MAMLIFLIQLKFIVPIPAAEVVVAAGWSCLAAMAARILFTVALGPMLVCKGQHTRLF